ncbi:unnamed protein product [Auanema sp. JU1783]|nr:unnamed protein product [Auanema sp. JU1783]
MTSSPPMTAHLWNENTSCILNGEEFIEKRVWNIEIVDDMAMEAQPAMQATWPCATDSQDCGPIYSRYAQFEATDIDIDNMSNCDISDLDQYLHADNLQPSTSYNVDLPQQPDNNLLQEFFTSKSSRDSSPSSIEWQSSPSPPSESYSGSSYTSASTSGVKKDNLYRVRRDKNNLASKKSRAKRQDKIKEMKALSSSLEKRNVELKAKVSSLEALVEDYKKTMLMLMSRNT